MIFPLITLICFHHCLFKFFRALQSLHYCIFCQFHNANQQIYLMLYISSCFSRSIYRQIVINDEKLSYCLKMVDYEKINQMVDFIEQDIFISMDNKPHNFSRRDTLISLEDRARAIWNRYQYSTAEPYEKPKFFITFASPLINGKLNNGHAFSITKCDFNAWYKRLCGFNVLFPYSYHCTGMHIPIAAQKINEEIQKLGNPPPFQYGVKSQYHILRKMRIKQEQIIKFKDPMHWTRYFPTISSQNLHNFGVHVDHARSFVTTDINPYYSSFVQWQFNILKEKGYIKFGKRPSIYSPKNKQICSGHDRSQGQSAVPAQYIVAKIKIIELNERMKKTMEGRNVFLASATDRPETLYGQASCFLLPSGEYCAIEMKDNQVFICSQRSANNMAYQGLTKQSEKVQIIDKLKGEQMMGLSLNAPLSVHKIIYTLPMMVINMKKGTGIITCVPSDYADHWVTIRDLKTKTGLMDKFGLTQEMVNMAPIEIINTPSYGNLIAISVCDEMKIKNQNDRYPLESANEVCKNKAMNEGKMLIGKYCGKKVNEASILVKNDIIDAKIGIQYYEPSQYCTSPSGEECVVRYCDQWFIDYANQNWKKIVLDYVHNCLKCSCEAVKKDIIYGVNQLKQWAFSRSFGLGTHIPFDSQYLIDNFSDGTIQMAYSTISHYLQANLQGSEPGLLGIKASDITPDFWDFILLGKSYTSSKIPEYKLQIMRESFLYWYPVDIRCCEKYLARNHLAMCLFNHVAIWQDDPSKWPKSFFCNGSTIMEGQIMSMCPKVQQTLQEMLAQYGADASRMACASLGDSVDDANFTSQIANSAIVHLWNLLMFMKKCLDEKEQYRVKKQENEDLEYFDKIFESQMEFQISKVQYAYENMVYRDVLKYGFHNFENLRMHYLINCDKFKPRRDLIERYIYLQLLFIYPICPHFSQICYIDYFLTFALNPYQYPNLISKCSFPSVAVQIDHAAIYCHEYINRLMTNCRYEVKKVKRPKKGNIVEVSKGIVIYQQKYTQSQLEIIKIIKSYVVEGQIGHDWRNQIKIENKLQRTKALKFGSHIVEGFKKLGQAAFNQQLLFDQRSTLQIFKPIIKKQLNLSIQFIELNQASQKWREVICNITPANPCMVFE